MAVAALDMFNINPWSRINSSDHGGLAGVREWVRKYLRGLRGGPRGSMLAFARANRASTISGTSTSSSQSGSQRSSIPMAGQSRAAGQPVYSRPSRPSLTGSGGHNGNAFGGAAVSNGSSYWRANPANGRAAGATAANSSGVTPANGSNHRTPPGAKSSPTKPERVGAIQRQR